MDEVEKHQQQLLEKIQRVWSATPITDATVRAYLETPRHKFIKRYRKRGSKEWHGICEENLEEHLANLYKNDILILHGDDDDYVPSTISQPSLVLRMLDMLQLKPGQTVFELGAGSAWNAALMGQLVGPEGNVYSLEIIPEVAKTASETVAALGLDNVHVIATDGGEGYASGGPYDRAIFTAGTYDLPHHFYEQIKENGLFLVVIKSQGGGDNLFVLRKTRDHFESLDSMMCAFVQFRGKYEIPSLDPITVEELPDWGNLRHHEISRTPFWWGGKGKETLLWRTLSIRSFLGISEPSFRAFKTAKADAGSREEIYFGLWDEQQKSLVLAKDDCLIAYASPVAKNRLLQRIQQWVDLGMPSAASFVLHVYPISVQLSADVNQWIVTRNESQFLWKLDV